jgi:hypothetical protein
MHPLETYLRRLHEIRSTERGTPELSYRAALENLLNAVGSGLTPPVQATAELADTGAGRPDFGLFDSRSGDLRSAVEVKAVAEDAPLTADGRQVARYWKHYGCVLVTNYRDFLLVVKEPGEKTPRVEGRYQLAADEDTFWRARPHTLAKQHGDGLLDFLAGVMTRTMPITRPADLAADLARHAREAKRRLAEHDISAIEPLEHAMEQALGLHFQGDEGTAFFRSSLVQTLFYGLFSGWMLWRQSRRNGDRFDWKGACEYLALPLIGDLYEEIARPRRLADLGLREPLEWATASLNRVVEEEFFQRFQTDHAITLFYEPFLRAFDPELRKELGVWYTPPEIVEYMVGRVDQLLRSELGIADGLADDQVFVLDPAAGTGSYLVEVARRIHQTLVQQGHGALAAAQVKKALRTRIFGFEILPAPYVVAHLQLGVFLRSLGATMTGRERLEVFLTNALTGWEPPKEPKTTLLFPELEEEAERAMNVKRDQPILVILGNPPYNGFAGVALEEEADLIRPYKEGLSQLWGVKRQLLDDLYVRFFRLGERRISEIGGRGIVCFISNYSWLDGLSHAIMRERLTAGFHQIWIDNCNGDKYKTGKRTPDGKPDQSMFTTDSQPVGIQVGTAIATLLKTGIAGNCRATVRYRDLWGLSNEKRAALVSSLDADNIRNLYNTFEPTRKRRWVLVPGVEAANWSSWPDVTSLFKDNFKGVQPGRGGSLVSVDREPLRQRMQQYFDSRVSNEELRIRQPELMHDEARYDAFTMRNAILNGGATFSEQGILSIEWLPFDVRYIYWERSGKLLNEKRAEFREHVAGSNLFLALTQKPRKGTFSPPLVTPRLGSYYVFDPYTSYFPRILLHNDLHGAGSDTAIRDNIINSLCQAWNINPLNIDGSSWASEAQLVADEVFFHILAVLWSPAYRLENEAALRQDWPRVPIPASRESLSESACLGHAVADLLLPDRPVRGVTCGTIRPELRPLGIASKVGGGNIEPGADLKVEATWGFFGAKNAVMCGKGKTAPSAADPQTAVDVYLNNRVYWANVPLDVWTATIGGYPVIKKWLSYREFRVLGRPLHQEEMTYITDVVRRLKALLLMGDALDANYRATADSAMAFGRLT